MVVIDAAFRRVHLKLCERCISTGNPRETTRALYDFVTMSHSPSRLGVSLSLVVLVVTACDPERPTPPAADAGAEAGPDQPVLPGEWKVLASMATPRRSEVGAGVIDGKIYVAGGRLDNDSPLDLLEIYDPAADTWTRGPAMPAPRDHAGTAAVNGKLYVIGGYGPSIAATVFEFDPGSSTWSTKTPMASARAAFAVAVVGTKIHCVGGVSGKAHQAYDVSTDTWETLPDLPTGREHLAAAAIGTTIYVVGGRVSPFPYANHAELESYDTVTKTWTKLPAMPTARGGLGAAALNGKLYAFGGEFPDVFPEVEEYDPTTQGWRSMKNMPTPRHGIAPVTVNGWIHVVAGGRELGTAGTVLNEAFKPE